MIFKKPENNRNQGMCACFVGAQQTGKSSMMKRLLAKVPASNICAVEMNYGEYEGCAYRTTNFEDLIEIGLENKNLTLIFDEASSYVSSHTNEFKPLLTRNKGHLFHRIFFAFHWLSSVPVQILPNTDYIYYTKTIEKVQNIPFPLSKIDIFDKEAQWKWYNQEIEKIA